MTAKATPATTGYNAEYFIVLIPLPCIFLFVFSLNHSASPPVKGLPILPQDSMGDPLLKALQ